jgi:hypothetical protein
MKLNDKKVAEIKADLCDPKNTQPTIAKKYKISRSTVSDIATERAWKHVPWPNDGPPLPKRGGGQRKKAQDHDPTNARIMELEADIVHLTDERNRERAKVKAGAKTQGLFNALVKEMETRVQPFKHLPPADRNDRPRKPRSPSTS